MLYSTTLQKRKIFFEPLLLVRCSVLQWQIYSFDVSCSTRHDIVNQHFAFSYSVIIKTCCNLVEDKHRLVLESRASYSALLCYRGIIVFANKSYILEPIEGATTEHKIYRAENLKIAPGSCGHQLDISAVRSHDTTHHSQAGRVGGLYSFTPFYTFLQAFTYYWQQ